MEKRFTAGQYEWESPYNGLTRREIAAELGVQPRTVGSIIRCDNPYSERLIRAVMQTAGYPETEIQVRLKRTAQLRNDRTQQQRDRRAKQIEAARFSMSDQADTA